MRLLMIWCLKRSLSFGDGLLVSGIGWRRLSILEWGFPREDDEMMLTLDHQKADVEPEDACGFPRPTAASLSCSQVRTAEFGHHSLGT